jgi:fatty-acyl-CoA synthase
MPEDPAGSSEEGSRHREAIWAEAITVGDLLLRTSDSHPDREALVLPGVRLTYADLAEAALSVARGLIGAGLQAGEHVGYLLPNGAGAVAAFYGIALAGGVVVPMNTRYRSHELPFVIAGAELAVIVTTDEIADHVDLIGLVNEALGGLGASDDPRALCCEAAPNLRSVVNRGTTSPPGMINERPFLDLAAITDNHEVDVRRLGRLVGSDALRLFTSGTTAQPRAARLTHEALVRNWTENARLYGLGPGDKVWVPCPLFHLGAIGPMLMCAAAGATMVSDVHFDPDRAIDLLAEERPAVWYSAYPPITQGLLTHPRFGEIDQSGLRALLNVAPPESQAIVQAAVPGASLVSVYGLTEGGGVVTVSRLDDPVELRLGTDGTPLSGTEVRIADPVTGAATAEYQPGEILIRGVGLFGGYVGEVPGSHLDADGWFHTGDRGVLGTEGRLRYLGRWKDMLKVGGENVAAVEIEAFLSTHPAVKLVQVVGIPDPRLVEIPVAVVELRPGASISEDELLAYCSGRLARFKITRRVLFVIEWPMSASKVQKGKLRDQVLQLLSAVPAPG